MWTKIHVNSLIGSQKIIENNNANLWYCLIVPILNIPAIIIFIVLSPLIYFLFLKIN